MKNRNNISADVPERRHRMQLRNKLHETNARLAAIVKGSDDAIIGKDLNGIITSWNKCAERIYSYTEAEAIGRPVSMLAPAWSHGLPLSRGAIRFYSAAEMAIP